MKAQVLITSPAMPASRQAQRMTRMSVLIVCSSSCIPLRAHGGAVAQRRFAGLGEIQRFEPWFRFVRGVARLADRHAQVEPRRLARDRIGVEIGSASCRERVCQYV